MVRLLRNIGLYLQLIVLKKEAEVLKGQIDILSKAHLTGWHGYTGMEDRYNKLQESIKVIKTSIRLGL